MAPFDVEKFKKALKNSILGYDIDYFPYIENSTMNTCEDILKSGKKCCVVITDSQGHGRGLNARKWESASTDNLYFTVGLTSPEIDIAKEPSSLSEWLKPIRLSVGAALCSSLREVGCKSAMLKWPNDVLVDEKKAVGILIESYMIEGKIWGCGIGIGINVNCDTSAFSSNLPSFAVPPTSLKESCGKEFVKEDILAKFLDNFWSLIQPFNIHLDTHASTKPTAEEKQSLFDELLTEYTSMNIAIGKHVNIYPKKLFDFFFL